MCRYIWRIFTSVSWQHLSSSRAPFSVQFYSFITKQLLMSRSGWSRSSLRDNFHRSRCLPRHADVGPWLGHALYKYKATCASRMRAQNEQKLLTLCKASDVVTNLCLSCSILSPAAPHMIGCWVPVSSRPEPCGRMSSIFINAW